MCTYLPSSVTAGVLLYYVFKASDSPQKKWMDFRHHDETPQATNTSIGADTVFVVHPSSDSAKDSAYEEANLETSNAVSHPSDIPGPYVRTRSTQTLGLVNALSTHFVRIL